MAGQFSDATSAFISFFQDGGLLEEAMRSTAGIRRTMNFSAASAAASAQATTIVGILGTNYSPNTTTQPQASAGSIVIDAVNMIPLANIVFATANTFTGQILAYSGGTVSSTVATIGGTVASTALAMQKNAFTLVAANATLAPTTVLGFTNPTTGSGLAMSLSDIQIEWHVIKEV